LCDSSTATKEVYFSKTLDERDLRLIEVTPDIANRVQQGEVLKIMGAIGEDGKSSATSEAVLCTRDKTFSIKKVETSNSVFLVPPLVDEAGGSPSVVGGGGGGGNISFSIESRCGVYYELKQMPGKVNQLEGLLRKSQYKYGETQEEKDKLFEDGILLTRKQVMESVQASEQELEAAFITYAVVELGGFMRILSKVTLRDVTRNLLDEIIENDWKIDNIEQDKCTFAMRETDESLVILTLSRLGEKATNEQNSNSHSETRGPVWCLDYDKVAKISAHILFQNHLQENALSLKKGWQCQDFMMAWERHTPGAAPTEEHLEGIAVKINDTFEYIGSS